MCASSRLTWRGIASSPLWSIRPRSLRPVGDVVHRRPVLVAGRGEQPVLVAEQPRHRPGHPQRRASGRHARAGARARTAAPPAAGSAARGTRPGSAAAPRARRRGTRGATSPARCAVGPGELDRPLEVLVVDVQELERRPSLVEQVARTDRPEARPPNAIWRSSHTRSQPSTLSRSLRSGSSVGREQVLVHRLRMPSTSAARGRGRPGPASRGRRGCGACGRCRRSARACRARPCASRSAAPGTTGGRRGRARGPGAGVRLDHPLDDAGVQRPETAHVVDVEAAVGGVLLRPVAGQSDAVSRRGR